VARPASRISAPCPPSGTRLGAADLARVEPIDVAADLMLVLPSRPAHAGDRLDDEGAAAQ